MSSGVWQPAQLMRRSGDAWAFLKALSEPTPSTYWPSLASPIALRRSLLPYASALSPLNRYKTEFRGTGFSSIHAYVPVCQGPSRCGQRFARPTPNRPERRAALSPGPSARSALSSNAGWADRHRKAPLLPKPETTGNQAKGRNSDLRGQCPSSRAGPAPGSWPDCRGRRESKFFAPEAPVGVVAN